MTPVTGGGGRCRVACGVDIGGTKLLGVAVSGEAVVSEARVETPSTASAPELAAAVADVVARVRPSGDVGTTRDVPVGVGIPGMLAHHGVLAFSAHLPAAAGWDLRSLVAERLGGAPVVVANDANCTALAELELGAARGARNAVVVTLGTGIGGGLVVDGRVVEGAHGYAGEVGHMVVDPSGPPCPCGGRGCWERYASGGGLGRLAREAAVAGTLPSAVAMAGGDPESVRGEHVTALARAGDPGSLAVMEQLGWWLALGLANLAALLDPERIVVGGGLAQAGDVLFGPARRAYGALVEGGASRPDVPIVPAVLGERAGAIGAALRAASAGAGGDR